MRLLLAICLLGASLSSEPASTQSSSGTNVVSRDDALYSNLNIFLRNNAESSIEAIVERAHLWFQTVDQDGGGFGESDRKHRLAKTLATYRANRMRQWLSLDLDGNGELTMEEASRALMPSARRPLRSSAGQLLPTEDQIKKTLDQLLRKSMPKDPNGDGVVTLAEMFAQSGQRPDARRRLDSTLNRYSIDMALDANGDGLVVWEEFETPLRAILKRADTDGDGLLSGRERSSLQRVATEARSRARLTRRALRRENDRRARIADCKLPRAREGTELVSLQIGEGQALPTVSLGGDAVVTSLADFEVSPGTSSIYLIVATQRPVVLRFSGAIERIQRIIAIGQKTGFIGVDRARIQWQDQQTCTVGQWSYVEHERGDWSAMLASGTGRVPDHALFLPHAGRVSLPGGQKLAEQTFPGRVAPDLEGPAGEIWKSFSVFVPGGVVHLRANAIHATMSVDRYSVLPHLAGLATMVEAGDLDLLDPGAIFRVKTPGRDGCVDLGTNRICGGTGSTKIRAGGATYLLGSGGVLVEARLPVFEIRRQIHFPAGLQGAQSAVLHLPDGIAPPTGPRGDAKVLTGDRK